MSDSLSTTQAMLAKHHRDGEAFAQMMKDSFASRFNEEFWRYWQEKIAPHLSTKPVVLDLGTGPATFLVEIHKRYPEIKTYGVECAEYMLAAMETLPNNAEVITADLHNPHLPIEDNSVDAVVASVVIHEMHQPIKTFKEMFRCLKPGGIFYILDWVRAPLSQYLDGAELNVFADDTEVDQLEDLFVHFFEHNRFSINDLIFMLEKVGFKVLETNPLYDGRQARLLVTK